MRVLVNGGDDHPGWPIALHLPEPGHDVTVNDGCARCHDEGTRSEAPIGLLKTNVMVAA